MQGFGKRTTNKGSALNQAGATHKCICGITYKEKRSMVEECSHDYSLEDTYR